jgi:CubicO group peptidase (beta-lactamase class C family)
VLTRAWGNATDTEKNSVDTKFNIGSINKAFTKAAIEQLAKQGKLSLDDTVRKHLPDYPSGAADRITIRQLLEHRSGLGDIFGPKYFNAPPSRLRELSDFLPLFADAPLEFDPGTSQRYSNAGYVVLGLIIERISGEKYRDYVRKNLFEPAGMKDTGFWAIDEKVAKRATGYTLRGPDGPLAKRASNADGLPGRPSSAGGAFATASDLLKFFQWMKADGVGVAGGTPGANAVVEMNNGWAVIALSNFDPPSAEELARNAMQIIGGGAHPMAQMRRGPTGPEKIEMANAFAVPLGHMDHLVTVEAKLNGKGPYRFVVDSGAGGQMRVSPAVAKALDLEEVGEALSGDPSGKNMVRRPVVRVEDVQIGSARMAGVMAAVADRPGPGEQPDGVIGLSLFSGLTVTIDYPKEQLRVSREPLPAAGEHVVPFRTEHGIPQIDVEPAGVKMTADVDTGSPALLSTPPSAGLPFSGEPRVVGKGRTVGNEFDIKAAELNGDLRVAGWTQARPMVDIVDLFPRGNIGARFLRQYAVTFDLANKRLQLMR